jgi:hypothetical protein
MRVDEAVANIVKARRLATSTESIQGSEIDRTRMELLKMITEKTPYLKELKGKHLSRVFWETATPDNLDKVESLLAKVS